MIICALWKLKKDPVKVKFKDKYVLQQSAPVNPVLYVISLEDL